MERIWLLNVTPLFNVAQLDSKRQFDIFCNSLRIFKVLQTFSLFYFIAFFASPATPHSPLILYLFYVFIMLRNSGLHLWELLTEFSAMSVRLRRPTPKQLTHTLIQLSILNMFIYSTQCIFYNHPSRRESQNTSAIVYIRKSFYNSGFLDIQYLSWKNFFVRI